MGDDESLIVGNLLDIVAVTTGSDRAAFYRIEDDGTLLVLVDKVPYEGAVTDNFRRLPVVSSPMGAAVKSGVATAHAVKDLGVAGSVAANEGISQVAYVPLKVRGRSTGALSLARNSDQPYRASEVVLAEIVAELFVDHIEHARLYGDARRRLDETNMLLDVSRAVTASLELDRRLEASADILTRMVDASNAFILLLDEDRTVLRGVATSNPIFADHFRSVRIQMSTSSLAVRAVETKKPVAVEDTRDAVEGRRDLVDAYGEKSLLALPLIVGREAIGAVMLDDTSQTRVWTPGEIARGELIAHAIAGAVANARLYDEVRNRSTELERAQQALVARERLAALGQLSATLAHEVRNPLGVMFNSVGTLRKLLTGGGDAAALLDIMDEEARRLDRLVRELLEFAKPVAPSLESESFAQVLESAIDAVRKEIGPDGPKLTAQVPKGFPAVRLDASQIRRALVNVVRNGAQAAGEGGSVIASASLVAWRDSEAVRLDVTDTGPGIDAETARRVFEPFFTTKATGTGLGLAIVRSIVEGHGGEVTLASSADGTTVTVFLPTVAILPARADKP